MNTKRLITTSIFALISASAVHAADVMVPHKPAPVSSSAFVAPAFTWTGFYFGVQAGGFSSKTDMGLAGEEKVIPLSKDLSPKLSGFEGGFYAGSNIDLGDNFVFGIDTDLTWSGQKHTKTITIGVPDSFSVDGIVARSRRSAELTPTSPAPAKPAATKPAGTAGGPGAGTPASAKPAPVSSVSGAVQGTGRVAAAPKAAQEIQVKRQPLVLARLAESEEKPAGQGASSLTLSDSAHEQSEQAGKKQASTESAAKVSGSSSSEQGSSGGASGNHGHGHSHGGRYRGGHYGGGAVNPHGPGHPGYSGGQGSKAHPHVALGSSGHGTQNVYKNDAGVYAIEEIKKAVSELGLEEEVEALDHTLKQNWAGATRVRIGFVADRFMPYVAGGIAYTQLQDTVSVSVKSESRSEISSKDLTNEIKTMIGYTLGGGVDFAMLDNVVVRAEYRYSDFGKKNFAKEKLEMSYKTNDFRVGVAYKF
ncbi:outer membrane protein [Bartonella rattaustraliani]|uniref:outer membrane protein n=1 Tax=Bartonella rattaustraliani TaxID=481139 RepID=UPI0002EC8CD5|nr:outer membrane beta-barrel protein [Bartonella rattaustraliani]